MNNFKFSYTPEFPDWKKKLLYWAKSNYAFVALSQGNNYSYPEDPFQNYFFAGNQELTEEQVWDDQFKKFKIGIFGYDLKNRIEDLKSNNASWIDLPEMCFFTPEICFQLKENKVESQTDLTEDFWEIIEAVELPPAKTHCEVTPLIGQEEYISAIHSIKNLIIEGETYEMNFCQSYQGTFIEWDPISAFFKLQEVSPMPFSALFKANNKWLVSASPERFLKKSNRDLISQPIKGTIKRGKTPEEDLIFQKRLSESEKERAENLMITDLTRNDLSKVSKIGSVNVNELFGIYPLPRVFQMISTVGSVLKDDVTFKEIIHATFPMGSMTGAPKINTMKLIEELECFKRGWFSGAFGWVDESGDFDFSVVIRSIIADTGTKKLYFAVGSAITIDSDPLQEFEECQIKSQAIKEVLNGTRSS